MMHKTHTHMHIHTYGYYNNYRLKIILSLMSVVCNYVLAKFSEEYLYCIACHMV